MKDGALIWAALPMPALVIDGVGRIVGVNPAAEDFMNLSARALEGSALTDRLRTKVGLPEALGRSRRDLSPVFIDKVDIAAGDAAPRLCNLRIAPFGGKRLLLLLEPRQMADRLGRTGAARGAAKSAIGMAEMLTHEVRNPLAGIIGAAQLLAMTVAGDDRKMTELIVAESRRIVALLDQVEQFGNLRPPVRRATNIHDVLDRARTSALLSFASGLAITEDYDPSLPPTLADGDQILQVVQNLLKNAAEAGAGRICLKTCYDRGLRLRRADGQSGAALPLRVEIVDDGPGLPPDIAAAVFDPFVSGRENGTGLGLALVSKIILDHEGWISVESRPGATCFRISLPVAETEGEMR